MDECYSIPRALPDAFLVLVQYLASTGALLEHIHANKPILEDGPETHTPHRGASSDTVFMPPRQSRAPSRDSSYTFFPRPLNSKLEKLKQNTKIFEAKLLGLMAQGRDQLILMAGYAYKKRMENCDSPNTESLILQIVQALLERNYEVEKTRFQTSLSRTNRMTDADMNISAVHAIRADLKEIITSRNVLSQQMQVLDSFQRNSDWSGKSFEQLLECTATARKNKALLRRTKEIVSRQLGEVEKFETRFQEEFERVSTALYHPIFGKLTFPSGLSHRGTQQRSIRNHNGSLYHRHYHLPPPLRRYGVFRDEYCRYTRDGQ